MSAILIGLCLSACAGQSSTSTAPVDLAEHARSHGRLGVFLDALDRAGLGDIFDGRDQFTIFAPQDAAFGELDLDTIGEDVLRRIIRGHVVSGQVTYATLAGEKQTLRTLNGDWVEVEGVGGLSIEGARLVRSDLTLGPVTIHVIDRVLNTGAV